MRVEQEVFFYKIKRRCRMSVEMFVCSTLGVLIIFEALSWWVHLKK